MSGLAMAKYYSGQGQAYLGAEPATTFTLSGFASAAATPTTSAGLTAGAGTAKSLTEVDSIVAGALKAGAVTGDVSTEGGVLIRRVQGAAVLVNEDFPVSGGMLGRLKSIDKKYLLAGGAALVGVVGLMALRK